MSNASGAEAAANSAVESLADAAVLRPLRAGNSFEDTVERLLQLIRLGIVEPGAALPSERDLAARFSVSRDTVREAIRSLSDAGWLVSRRGRYGGTFVSELLPTPPVDPSRPSSSELEDVLGLRSILEVGAARAAAARDLGASDREALWSRTEETASAGLADYRRLDSRLHLTIAELVGVPSLVPLIADNRSRVNALLDGIPLLQPNIEHSNQQHEVIVSAILRGSPDLAGAAMAEHLEGSAALLRGFLR